MGQSHQLKTRLWQHQRINRAKAERGQARQRARDPQLTEDDVLITQGAISANFLVLYALLGPTEHAICVYPVYTQLYSVPETFGSQVSFWQLKEEKGFIPEVQDLNELFQCSTKVKRRGVWCAAPHYKLLRLARGPAC